MSWNVLSSKDLFKAGFFTLRVDECELPDGRVMPRYYVMDFIDWVNVIALDQDGNMILVEQYRHAAKETLIEIPGGSTDPGETPRAAAARELLEETGYSSTEWIDCGFHYPNPALQSNRMHTFIAFECQRTAEPSLDPFEDLVTRLVPAKVMYEGWLDGEVKHSIISASLALGWRRLNARGILS